MASGKFRNPYNFVPFGDAGKIGRLSGDEPLGQGAPKSHERYHEDHWSGRIEIRVEVKTPLLIPDISREKRRDGHATLPLLKDANGKPVLPVTSLKGPLRAAFEAITNSRMGVFQNHNRPPARRMVPGALLPAVRLTELSPADRVFGWVRQKGKGGPGAWRGQLRIRPIECLGLLSEGGRIDPEGEVIQSFQPPLPLAILSSPKVAQARFYVGTKEGAPLGTKDPGQPGVYKNADISKAAYFEKLSPEARPKWQLRGRKFYPHHRFSLQRENYWDAKGASEDAKTLPQKKPQLDDPPEEFISWQAPHREYVRRKGWYKERRGRQQSVKKQDKNKDKQNRSIREWIVPGAIFSTTLEVVNLNKPELGALLWLLDLPHFAGKNKGGEAELFHRIGAGKPLGFGSVKITLAGLELKNGQARKDEFKSLMPQNKEAPKTTGAEIAQATDCEAARPMATSFVREYRQAIARAYAQGNEEAFTDIPFIKAFLQAARGYADDKPTHYPRTQPVPNVRGENFRWFVANNSDAGKKYALGPLADDPGLPYDPEE